MFVDEAISSLGGGDFVMCASCPWAELSSVWWYSRCVASVK